MKKKNNYQIRFSLIALITFAFLSLHQPVIAQTETRVSKNAPELPIQLNKKKNKQDGSHGVNKKKKQQDGSNRGRPTRRRAMGNRNGCPGTSIPFTALIADNTVGKVVEANPTFWFFIPYKSSKIPLGEFVLQDEAHNDVYRTDLSINKGEGIVGITLSDQKTLEVNKTYQWYFKLYCDRDKSSTPIYLHGWVERIALQPQQEKQLSGVTSPGDRIAFYSQNGIWYSAFTELAKLKQANADAEVIGRYWLQLLNNIGLQDLSNQPIVGKVD